MPEPIATRKTAPRRVAPRLPAETGTMRVEDLFPELRAARPKAKPASEVRAARAVTPRAGTPAVRPGNGTTRVGAKPSGTPTAVRATSAPRATAAEPVVRSTRRPTPTPASGPVRKPGARPPSSTGLPRAAAPVSAPAAPVAAPTAAPAAPRFSLIAGTGAALTLMFICLIILNSSLQVSAVTVEDRMRAGEVALRHETWEPGNCIVDVTSLSPEVADVDIFLVQDEDDPGFVHFLVEAKRVGSAAIVIEYENKDRKVVNLAVDAETTDANPREDRKARGDVLERVREQLRAADELLADADKSVENSWKAYAGFQRALRLLKQIRLYQFLPEFKGLEDRIRQAADQVEVRYKKVEAEYQVARDRQMDWKARELLSVLMQIVPDAKDPRFLKNRTYLEYLHLE